jgi:hypothetical protein
MSELDQLGVLGKVANGMSLLAKTQPLTFNATESIVVLLLILIPM